MSAMNFPEKRPAEKLDYTLNWAQANDPIDTSTWTISNDDGSLEIDEDLTDFTTTTTTVWLSAGASKRVYELLNQIETVGGRIFERAVTIAVA